MYQFIHVNVLHFLSEVLSFRWGIEPRIARMISAFEVVAYATKLCQ